MSAAMDRKDAIKAAIEVLRPRLKAGYAGDSRITERAIDAYESALGRAEVSPTDRATPDAIVLLAKFVEWFDGPTGDDWRDALRQARALLDEYAVPDSRTEAE